jgi:pimeloyl-ACP methyl ester carboxylesterase
VTSYLNDTGKTTPFYRYVLDTRSKGQSQMNFVKLARNAALIALGCVLPFTLSTKATAQLDVKASPPNVLLVHGSWVDGSSWSKVIPLLESKGFRVVAVQLPLTSLADDVATTQRALALIDGPVTLVGHSYGGDVITQAGVDPKVKGWVYIAAFAPDAGESALSLLKSSPVESAVGTQMSRIAPALRRSRAKESMRILPRNCRQQRGPFFSLRKVRRLHLTPWALH